MKLILWCVLLCLPRLATAQADEFYRPKTDSASARTYRIVLRDGTQLRGTVVRQDSAEVVVRTGNRGEVRLRADQISRLEPVDSRGRGDASPNLFPQTMRFAPTAFSAEKGRGYFRNYFVYFSQFEYGITDNWSIGTTFLTFLPTNVFSLTTKVSVPVGSRVRLGLSAQYAALRFDRFLFSTNVFADVGYVQALVTTGDRRNNNTYGLGWTIDEGDVSRNFIGTFGLVRKVNPRLTFISENFVLFGNRAGTFAGVVSAGIRFDRRRHAFDVAANVPLILVRNRGAISSIGPFASYHLRIGK